MPRLFLFDGTAVAYRSHFAMMRSGLSTPDGRPTGATYGFTMALRRILRDEKPDLVAVALDAKGPTFRHERYAEYKATRERAPEEMIEQLEDIRRIVRAHGIELFEIPGYEADDVIGTLATPRARGGPRGPHRDRRQGHDAAGLGGGPAAQHLQAKVDLVIEGPEEVHAKFGTTPEHVIDVLAIMGDASDNVPGVKGIGEKGAQKLIGEFGSVARPARAHRRGEGQDQGEDRGRSRQPPLSLELVTIDTDVPLEPGLEAITPSEPDVSALRGLFQDLDFRSLAEEVSSDVEVDGVRASARTSSCATPPASTP